MKISLLALAAGGLFTAGAVGAPLEMKLLPNHHGQSQPLFVQQRETTTIALFASNQAINGEMRGSTRDVGTPLSATMHYGGHGQSTILFRSE